MHEFKSTATIGVSPSSLPQHVEEEDLNFAAVKSAFVVCLDVSFRFCSAMCCHCHIPKSSHPPHIWVDEYTFVLYVMFVFLYHSCVCYIYLLIILYIHCSCSLR